MRPALLIGGLIAVAGLAFTLEAGWGPRFGGELKVLLPALPSRFGPPDGDPAERLVASLVHERLVTWGGGEPQPALAESWSAAAGGREWTLRLRAGALFHDRRPVTAEHAVVSLRRFLRSRAAAAAHLVSALEGGAAFASGQSDELAGLQALDERSLVLRLNEPRVAALAALASVSAAVVGADGSGAGPFAPTFTLPAKRVALRAFSEHVRGRPFLDRLQLEAAADRGERSRSLEAGASDLAFDVAGPAQAWTMVLLVFDTSRPPFDDPASRAAADAVLDRRDLATRWSDGGEPRFDLGFIGPAPAADSPPRAGALRGTIALEVGDVPVTLSRRVVALLSSLGARVAIVASGSREAAHARLVRYAPDVAERALQLRELLALAGAPAGRIAALEAADAQADLGARRAALDGVASVLQADRACLPLLALPLAFAALDGVHGARFDATSRLVLEDVWRDGR